MIDEYTTVPLFFGQYYQKDYTQKNLDKERQVIESFVDWYKNIMNTMRDKIQNGLYKMVQKPAYNFAHDKNKQFMVHSFY